MVDADDTSINGSYEILKMSFPWESYQEVYCFPLDATQLGSGVICYAQEGGISGGIHGNPDIVSVNIVTCVISLLCHVWMT